MRISVPVKEGVRGIRIDPAESSCIVRMESAVLNGMELPLSDPAYLAMNGWELTPKKDPHPVFFSTAMIPTSISGWIKCRRAATGF